MVIDLIGVIEDGFPRSAALPANQRTTLQFPIGTDVTIRLRILWARGEPVDLAGWVVTLTARKRPNDSIAFQKVATVQPTQGRGRADALVASGDTKPRLQPGRYVFEVTALDGAGKRNSAVPISPLVLEATL